MKLKDIADSPAFPRVIVALGVIVSALLVFNAGVAVGYRKASFSYRYGDNFYRSFGPSRDAMMGPGGEMLLGDIPGGNGAAGKVIKVNLPSIVVEGPDNVERVILITDDTIIRSMRDEVASSSIKENQFLVAIGSPNANSQIVAKLVRLFASPGGVAPGDANTTPQ